MKKSLYPFALVLCLTLFSACGDNDDEPYFGNQEQQSAQQNNDKQSAESTDNTNTNKNVLTDAASVRIEMPHVDAALIFVPHYVTLNGKKILNYTIQWNASMRHSTWVAYEWDSTTSAEDESVERKDNFKWDTDIPKTSGAVYASDYTKNGYHKGHICASEDRVFCQEANDQTFFYSNMSPQFSSFNQGFWKELEAHVRTWGRATQKGTYDTVYVAKGGTTNNLLKSYQGINKASDGVIPTTDANGYSYRSDGKVGLPVPTYYYMVLLSVKNGVYHAIAFCVPHSESLTKTPSKSDFQKYVITVDKLEELTGLDFFCNLPDRTEADVEGHYTLSDWSW